MTGFEDIASAFFGGSQASKSSPPTSPKVERGVQIHGRSIDGVYYVRAEDIVALLEINAVLPKVTAKLKSAVKP